MKRDPITAACEHLSDLNMFYAVIALLENSLIHDDASNLRKRIITLCKQEARRQLDKHDRAVAAAKKAREA